MTKSQKNFVRYFIESDFKNATAAYLRAFPNCSEESARRNASRLLTRADVLDYLSKVLDEIIKREKIPLEKRIFDVWAKRAFYDPAEIVNAQGALILPLEELSRQGLSVCIDGIESRISAQGETVKVRLADRNAALEMLQRYVQMVKPQVQKIEIISEETRAKLAALYDKETPGQVNPAYVEKQAEAPDDE
jgi:phage terminase small subunit